MAEISVAPDNADDLSASTRGLTWNRCAVVVVGALVGGIALLILLRDVYFAPPNLIATLFMRLAYLLAWLPVLVICLLLRPQGRKRIIVLLLIVNLLLSCLMTGLLVAPDIPFLTGEIITTASGTPQVRCEAQSLQGNRVRYTCSRQTIAFTDVYVLEGPEGSPFVRMVEN